MFEIPIYTQCKIETYTETFLIHDGKEHRFPRLRRYKPLLLSSLLHNSFYDARQREADPGREPIVGHGSKKKLLS
jgi:hypothetical protein